MPETTEVKVQISKAQVDEWAKARIKELEHELELTENREKRAKDKVKKLEEREDKVKQALGKIEEFTQELDWITDSVYKDYA